MIHWYKRSATAIIPTKRAEDAGFDIYTNIDHPVTLQPHEKFLFPTGLSYIMDSPHWLMAFDRGSTGSRGLHVHCGILDQGYTGEVFICLCNDNSFPVTFMPDGDEIKIVYTGFWKKKKHLIYTTKKAIAQLIPMALENCPSDEIDASAFTAAAAHSERGEGSLGSSGK